MSVSTAAKIGGAALASGGVPATSFVVYDSFFSLYKVEKDILDSTDNLSVAVHTPDQNGNKKLIYIKISKDSSWECIVKSEAKEEIQDSDTSKNSLVELIKNKLPKSDDNDETKKAEKQWNKKNLIKNCSKNRKSGETQSDTKVTSEITVILKDKGSTTTPRWTFEDENLGQLFGKGFWI